VRLFLFAASIIFLITSSAVQAQTETPVDPGKLAQCLSEKKFTMYGRGGCSACALEKTYFGESFAQVPYVECDLNDESRAVCDSKGITAYPTWEDVSGKQYKGAIPLPKLSELAGCKEESPAPINIRQLKEKSTPFFKVFSVNALKYWGIFLAGLISFLAPCVLPIIPGFLAYLAGSSLDQAQSHRRDIFLASLFFVFGFSAVFSSLGVHVTDEHCELTKSMTTAEVTKFWFDKFPWQNQSLDMGKSA